MIVYPKLPGRKRIQKRGYSVLSIACQSLRVDNVGAKPGYWGDQMNCVNFEQPLADSGGARIDVVLPQIDHYVARYQIEATPCYLRHCYRHHAERGTKRGSKIRDNVEKVVVNVGEKLVAGAATFYQNKSSLLAAHLE
jgi:hypothetical protein